MPILSVNGISMSVIDRGNGPVVLFVHGFPLNHSMWKAQLDALAGEYRVIAPDLRGFGASEVTPGTVSMEQCADDLAGLLDAMHVTEPVTFCGLSMGGYVAWPFVRKYPDRLRALVLCDTKASADTPEAVENRHKLAASVLKQGAEVVAQTMPAKLFAKATREHRPELVEHVKEMIRSAHPDGIAAALRGMAERPDATSLLPSIAVPTLIVVGVEDQLTTVKEMREFAHEIPNASILEVKSAGHLAPLEQPEPVNAALQEFLERLA